MLVAMGTVAAGCSGQRQEAGGREAASRGRSSKTFAFSIHDAVTIRKNPTTQVAIRVSGWPGQTFLLWFPEAVGDLWVQWDAAVAHQDFARKSGGGLRWEFDGNSDVRVSAELTPRQHSLLLDVRVTNRVDRTLRRVRAQNCFHLSAAPDFACDDFTRIHILVDGRWRSLDELDPSVGLPMYYRPEYPESGRPDSWNGSFRDHIQSIRADSPLIVCTSRDGERAVATASENWECVFHNQRMPYLLCIHSQQAPVSVLPAEEARFRQVIYFIEGGVAACVRAFQKDLENGVLRR